MDFKKLRTFVSVAELGSVSKASSRLRIDQPALSRHIMDLESELGLVLFDRIGRGMILSKDGEHLLKECRELLTQTARLNQTAQELRGGDAGSLRIAASPQILESLLSKFLLRYRHDFPKVKMKFTEAVGHAQLTLLRRGECDIGIGIGQIEAVSAESEFATFPLANLEILAAAPTSCPIGRRGTVAIGDLEDHPLLLLDESYAFRRLFDRTCLADGIDLNVQMESRAPHTLLAFAEAGHGIAVIQSAVAADRYKLRLLRVTRRGRPIGVPMKAIWDKRRNLPLYAKAFYERLGTYTRKVFPLAKPSAR